MGCDLHVILEIKHEGGNWQLWQKRPYLEYEDSRGVCNHEIDCLSARDYDFFAIIAGVRGSRSDQQYPTRGIPEDACDEVKEWQSEQDYHSLTHLSLEEMTKCMEFYSTKWATDNEDLNDKRQSFMYDPEGSGHNFNIDYLTLEPIITAYGNECAEAMLLGFENPDIRFIIGFDS
jgi:hypothetical protein